MLSPLSGRREKVLVRLAEIDLDLRRNAAERLIKSGRLRGLEAIKMDLAAVQPVENPVIRVDADKAYRVLVEKKLPPGPTPKFG